MTEQTTSRPERPDQDAAAGQRQLEILRHSLGLGTRSSEAWRNHFVCDPGALDHADCVALVQAGFMERRPSSALTGGMDCFVVTASGRDHEARNRPREPMLTRAQKRYQAFLDADSGLPFGEWLRYRPRGGG
jgi:hypothetical protein